MTRILGIELVGDYGSGPAIKAAVGDLREFANISEKAQASVERLAAQRGNLKMLATAYKDLAASAAEGSDEQLIALKKVSDAEARLAAQVKETGAAMVSTNARVKESSAGLGTLGASAKQAHGFVGKLGSSMALWLGAPALGAGIASAIHGTQEFSAAMELLHTQAGASQAEVTRMTAAVQKMASSVGTGPTELAAGLFHIESAGKRGAAALRVLKAAAEGARIGNANLEDVTNALNAVVVSGIKGAQNYEEAMGALNATVGAGDMRMQDLADAMGTGLPAKAQLMGLSLKDISAALAVFGDNNIRGAEAGTQLASAIRLMGAPSKAAAKELSGLGLSTTQLAEDMRSGGLVRAVSDLKDRMDKMGLTASQQAVVLTRAFGGRQSGGILLLINQLDRLKQKETEVGEGSRKFGRDWDAYTKQSQFATQKFQASLETLRIEVGNAILPTFTKATDSLSKWIDKENKSGQLAKDVKLGMDDLVGAFRVAKTAIDDVDKVTGSFKNTMELLLGIKVAMLVGQWSTSIAGLATKMGLVGTDASVAAGEVGGLRAALLALSAPEVLTGIGLVGGALYGLLKIANGGATQQPVSSAPLSGTIITQNGKQYYAPAGQRGRMIPLQQAVASGLVAPGTTANNGGLVPHPSVTPQSAISNMATGKQKMMALAQQALGAPYLWGGNGPGGFDCSGLVQWAFANGLNVNIPRTTYGQAAMGKQVSPGAAGVGDVVFTNYGEGGKSGPGHEGLIVGFKNGQPIIEAAPHTGAKVQTYTGYGAFTGGSAFTVRDLLASGGTPTDSTGNGGLTAAQLAALGLGPSGTGKKKKKGGIVSGADEIPASVQRQIAHTAEMVKQTQGETALEWVANEADALKAARKSLEDKIKGQSGKQARATQKEIDALDKKLGSLPVISGAHLLPQSLQDAIAKFKTDAIDSTGKAAEGYLKKEREELDRAVGVLKGELVGAKGKQAAAIRKELNSIDSNIATVNKQITANLKAQAQAIKTKAASAIASATEGVAAAIDQVIRDADAAFEQQTEDYITNTLAPEFYQGTNNPLEAKLAAMQAADTANELADALKQAKAQLTSDLASGGVDAETIAADKKAVAQAKRAIDENNLSIQATQLRRQEDADYAAAVKKWMDERNTEETKMNNTLEDFKKGVEDGTQSLDGKGGLTDVLGEFGLTASAVSDDDMAALGKSAAALAKVFADEAAKLSGVSGTAAQKQADAAYKRSQKLGGGGKPGSGGYTGKGAYIEVPRLASGGDIRAAGFAYLHSGERVQPASVVRSPGGGSGAPIVIQVNAPNYVGDKRDLASAIKSPQVQEAVATAVILASRGGHIRQGDIRP